MNDVVCESFNASSGSPALAAFKPIENHLARARSIFARMKRPISCAAWLFCLILMVDRWPLVRVRPGVIVTPDVVTVAPESRQFTLIRFVQKLNSHKESAILRH